MKRSRGITDDVRMRGFGERQTVEAALARLDGQLRPLEAETIALPRAAGRIMAGPVVGELDVPGFDRSMMDGYALVAASLDGASPDRRVSLTVIGDSFPDRPFHGPVAIGQAVRIMTGAPLPVGCDAVLPAENVDDPSESASSGPTLAATAPSPSAAGRTVYALAQLPSGKHVGRRGEDVAHGSRLFEAGRRLRPQDLGVLSSVGIRDVQVVRQPRVRLVVTGNELVPSGSRPHGYRLVDANGPMLTALAERDGGIVDFPGLVPDTDEAILGALRADADVVLVSGGTSVGMEDLVPMLLATHGELAVHGIAMRPGGPTGFGRFDHRLVFLLPGFPVSCLCAYDFFAGRAIRALGGRSKAWPYRSIRATLTRPLMSPRARLDYARVRVIEGRVEPIAITGASVLTSTTRADGFVIIPTDSEGFDGGSEVEVWLYE
jgi:molybdopterin molybdotransferase